MTPADLAKQCVTSINSSTELGLKVEEACIMITTPKGWKGGARFPRGRIVQIKEDGTRLRYLPAANVLAWLVANELVKMETK